MQGRKRKPASIHISNGNPGHRTIPVELDFAVAAEISGLRALRTDFNGYVSRDR
jgi:hypothetical protein